MMASLTLSCLSQQKDIELLDEQFIEGQAKEAEEHRAWELHLVPPLVGEYLAACELRAIRCRCRHAGRWGPCLPGSITPTFSLSFFKCILFCLKEYSF